MSSLRQALDESLTPATPGPGSRSLLLAVLAMHLVLALWLGWPEPGPTRWWDERFNVLNVESILAAGRLELANGYYGGVSYLPQTAVLAAAQGLHRHLGWPPAMVDDAHHLTPAGYHLIRASQALWGTLALWLLYRLARRLVSPGTAVLATAVMAVSPRVYQASAIFKPDVELVAATLLALILSALAVERRPSTWRYLAAGAAIGLAVGAKLNGVAVAFPLTLATALRYREWSRWPRLALAGVTSFGVFWCFNPDLPRVLRSLEKNRVHYEHTATGDFGDVLVETLSYPLRESFFGPWITGLALLGCLAVGLWLLRPAADDAAGRPRRFAWWMLLSYPPIYYALYALASPRAKANHFLLVVPFVALFAAVPLTTFGRWFAGGRSRRWRRVAVAAVFVAVLAPPAYGVYSWVYEQAVPSTWDQAQEWLEETLPEPLRAFRVATVERARRGRWPRSPAYSLVPPGDPRLDQLDALIAPRTAFDDPVSGDELRQRLRDDDVPRREFRPGWFRARDEAVIAASWARAPRPHPASGRLRFRRLGGADLVAELPAGVRRETISLRLRLGIADHWVPRLRLHAGGESYPLTLGPASGGDVFLTSPRLTAPADGRLSLSLEGRELQGSAKGELFVWESR